METLRELARRAVAEADPNGAGGLRMQAIKLLREIDDKGHRIRDYLDAVAWAIAQRSAADLLPEGSVVASPTVAFIKDHRVPDRPWSCTDGGHAPDEEIRAQGLGAELSLSGGEAGTDVSDVVGEGHGRDPIGPGWRDRA